MSGTCFDCVYWCREAGRIYANCYSSSDKGECRIDTPAIEVLRDIIETIDATDGRR